MKYLLLDNPAGSDKMFNVGDDIQVVAAKMFYNDFEYIKKGELYDYKGESAKIIMNGWFCHAEMDWPPSAALDPKYISFHINSHAERKMLDEKGVDYLKLHEPIGCRDITTLAMLKKRNISAFYSACITLTLKREYFTNKKKRKGVVINDISYKKTRNLRNNVITFFFKGDYNKLKKHKVNNRLIKNWVLKSFSEKDLSYTYHSIPLKTDDRIFRYKVAENLLKQYAEAELVITSRIHCALPCLALGTPVIFLDDSLSDSSERSRLDGLIDLFHVVRIEEGRLIVPDEIKHTGSLNTLKNKDNYKFYRELITSKLEGF